MSDLEKKAVEEEEKQVVKSITGRVLAFGVGCLLVMILLICAVLLIMLHNTSEQLIASKTKILEQATVLHDMERRLDTTAGRLSVYEDFLIGTQSGPLRQLVRRFLLEEKVRSDETTLRAFEEWVYAKGNSPGGSRHYGVGGPE